MDIKDQRITQIILVKFDEIPIEKLAHGRNLQRISDEFQFVNSQSGQAADGKRIAIFENGIYSNGNGELAINRLLVEERKTQLLMEGSSADAKAVFSALRELLKELKGVEGDSFMLPIVESYESVLTVHLDLPFDSLVSRPLAEIANINLPEATSNEMATTTARLSNLAFEIDYLPTTENLSEYRISLSRKKFVIEPRKGYPPEEQVYHSEAPLTTEEHLHLLSELEKAFGDAR